MDIIYRINGGALTLLANQTSPTNISGTAGDSVEVWLSEKQTATVQSAAAWSPSDVSGLEVWYDFSDTGTLTGDPITAVTDKSASGYNLGTGNSTPRGTMNSLTAADFDGTNDYLVDSAGTNSLSTSAKTIAVAFNADAISGYLFGNAGGGTNDRAYAFTDGFTFGGGPKVTVSPSPSTATNNVIVGWVLGTGATTAYASLNGDTTPVSGSVTIGTLANRLSVGAFWNGGTKYNGRIGEVIIYNSALSQSDRQKLEGYLANKWGATLEAGHPYESSPP